MEFGWDTVECSAASVAVAILAQHMSTVKSVLVSKFSKSTSSVPDAHPFNIKEKSKS
jgi:hypothetical protein